MIGARDGRVHRTAADLLAREAPLPALQNLHQLRSLARALDKCLLDILSDACLEPWTSSDALALRGENRKQ